MTFIGIPNTSGSCFQPTFDFQTKRSRVFLFFFFFCFLQLSGILKKAETFVRVFDIGPQTIYLFFLGLEKFEAKVQKFYCKISDHFSKPPFNYDGDFHCVLFINF